MKYKIFMLLTLHSLTLVKSAFAQQPEFELLIQGVHVRNSETALPVTIVTGDDLRSEVKSTLGDTLASQPGINNASFGPAVGQPVIRGQQGRRVMNLSNGIANADAAGNSADHATTIEPMLAESIEVLRGPSTLLYGGGAIGGVVNVVDRRIADLLFPRSSEIEFRHDTATDMDTLVAQTEFSTGQFAWHLDLTNRDWNDQEIPGFAIAPAWLDSASDDNYEKYIANSHGRSASATAGVSYIFNNGYLGLAVNDMGSNYGLPPGSHAHGEDPEFASIDMDKLRYDLIGEWNDLNNFIESISYRVSLTDYQHVEVEEDGAIGTRFNNDSVQHRVQLSHFEINNWHGVLGMQLNNERFSALGEESFIPVTDTDSFGLYIVEALHVDPITLELGARFSRDEFSPVNSTAPAKQFSNFSYSGSVLWDFNAYLTFGWALSHSVRPPWTEELYSNFDVVDVNDCVLHLASSSCELGNSSLQEEQSNNSDLSMYFDVGDLESTFTFFYNSFKDYIFLSNTGLEVNEFPVRRYIQEDARFYGLELDVNYFITTDWSLRIFADSIIGRLKTHGDVPRMPPNRIGTELKYSDGVLSSSLSMLHGMAQNNSGENEFGSKSYTRWDIDVNYLLTKDSDGELELFSRIKNITNQEIRLATSFLRGFAPESGRSLELGARYRF